MFLRLVLSRFDNSEQSFAMPFFGSEVEECFLAFRFEFGFHQAGTGDLHLLKKSQIDLRENFARFFVDDSKEACKLVAVENRLVIKLIHVQVLSFNFFYNQNCTRYFF